MGLLMGVKSRMNGQAVCPSLAVGNDNIFVDPNGL